MKLRSDRLLGGIVIILFYLILFQDLMGSFLFRIGIPSPVVKGFLFLKETIVILTGLCFILRVRVSIGRLIITLFLLYSAIFIFVSDLPIYYTLLGYRAYVLIFFAFLIGEQLGRYPDFTFRFLKHAKIIFWITLIFSVAEVFVLPTSIWTNVFPVIEMKRQVLELTIDEYYQTGLQVNAIGELTRRMIGPFNDPLTLSYFVALIVNFFIAQSLFSRGQSKFNAIWGSALIVLTQTRAIILGLVLSFVGIIFKNSKLKQQHIVIIGFSIVMVAISAVVFWDWVEVFLNTIFSKGGRNIGHLEAYSDGIKAIKNTPFGNGVGTSSVIVNFSSATTGTENAYINLAIEIGVAGFLLFFGTLVYFLLTLKNYLALSNSKATDYIVVAAGYLLLIQYIFAGFVAPHILTARILIPFMIVVGWAYSLTLRGRT